MHCTPPKDPPRGAIPELHTDKYFEVIGFILERETGVGLVGTAQNIDKFKPSPLTPKGGTAWLEPKFGKPLESVNDIWAGWKAEPTKGGDTWSGEVRAFILNKDLLQAILPWKPYRKTGKWGEVTSGDLAAMPLSSEGGRAFLNNIWNAPYESESQSSKDDKKSGPKEVQTRWSAAHPAVEEGAQTWA